VGTACRIERRFCLPDEACGGGAVHEYADGICDVQGACVPSAPLSKDVERCEANELCFERAGATRCEAVPECVPACVDDGDCGADGMCVEGQCQPDGCRTREQCPEGRRCWGNHCLVTPACGADTECDGGWCDDGQCAPSCGDVRCWPNQACVDPDANGFGECRDVCDEAGLCANGTQCVDGICGLEPEGCIAAADCAPDQLCVNGRCEGSCKGHFDCQNDQFCVGGQCARCDAECCGLDWVRVDEPCKVAVGVSCISPCNTGELRGEVERGTCAIDGRCVIEQREAVDACPNNEICVAVGNSFECQPNALACIVPRPVDRCLAEGDYEMCGQGAPARCVAGVCRVWTCEGLVDCHDPSPGHRIPTHYSEDRFLDQGSAVLDRQTGLQWLVPVSPVANLTAGHQQCAQHNERNEPSPWRMPSYAELLTIGRHEAGRVGLWPGAPLEAGWYLSRSRLWVDLVSGAATTTQPAAQLLICVRFDPLWAQPVVDTPARAAALQRGFDPITHLEWLTLDAADGILNYNDAAAVCINRGMLLPSVVELSTLLSFHAQPGMPIDLLSPGERGGPYWTRDRERPTAWTVDTSSGAVQAWGLGERFRVRCVRMGDR
jgi:hypothetical protein